MSINRTSIRSVVHVHEILSIAFGRREAGERETQTLIKEQAVRARKNWRRCLKVVRLARLACPRFVCHDSERNARCAVLPGYGTPLSPLTVEKMLRAPYHLDCHAHYRMMPGIEPYVSRDASCTHLCVRGEGEGEGRMTDTYVFVILTLSICTFFHTFSLVYRYGRSKFYIMVLGFSKAGSTGNRRRHTLLMAWPAILCKGVPLPEAWKSTMFTILTLVAPTFFKAITLCKAAEAKAGKPFENGSAPTFKVTDAAGSHVGVLHKCFPHDHPWVSRLGVTAEPDADSMVFQLMVLPPKGMYVPKAVLCFYKVF